MGIEKKNYSFRFHEDMVERLRAQAQLENRSLSNLEETILLQYLSTLEEKTTCEAAALAADLHRGNMRCWPSDSTGACLGVIFHGI